MTAYGQNPRKTLVIKAKSVRIIGGDGLEVSIEGSDIPWKEIIVNGNVYRWEGEKK